VFQKPSAHGGTPPKAVHAVADAVAQFERSLIAERVRSGMARGRKQGKRLGRPRAVNGEWADIRPLIENGEISQAEASRRLRVSRATVCRLVQNSR
jgi:putative DNA-invertase from lambdoid prophage Rac